MGCDPLRRGYLEEEELLLLVAVSLRPPTLTRGGPLRTRRRRFSLGFS